MWEKRFVEKDQQAYLTYLLSEANRLIHDRRMRMRVKHIDDTKKACAKSVKYAKKNAYIEDRILVTINYFNYLSDFNHKGQDMQKIQKQLFDYQRVKSRKERIQNVDPS